MLERSCPWTKSRFFAKITKSLITKPTIFLYQAAKKLESLHDADWEACAFSQCDPFKSSPNEDSAAVIPSNEKSVVIAVADGCGGFSTTFLSKKLFNTFDTAIYLKALND